MQTFFGGCKEPLESELYVHMLGRFAMTYGDRPISFKTQSTTKSMKLLQILLYYTATNGGISRANLLEELYYQEELCDIANNLRVTMHRLKKLLVQAGLPEYDYIQMEQGMYRWCSPMPTRIDALEFEATLTAAQQEDDPTRKAQLLRQACALYRGPFLPALSEDNWVIIHSVRYKHLYESAFLQLCEHLKQRREYEQLLDLTTVSVQMHPFEEWQTVKIDALIALNRYKEALQYYEETAKLFFEELGVSPSETMLHLLDEMSVQMGMTHKAASEVQRALSVGAYETGAFCCSLPSFRDNYRLICRLLDRTSLSVQVMLLSLTDGAGHPMENKEKLELLSEELHKAIKTSLRRSDCFTKYSPNQFLILLIGAHSDNCPMIFDRIAGRFSLVHKSWKKYIEYSVFPVSKRTESEMLQKSEKPE